MGNKIKNNDMKKQVRKSLSKRFEYFVDEYGVYTTAVILSGFLTLTSIGLIILLLFAACRQNQASTLSGDGVSTIKDTSHIAHYTRPKIPQMMTDPEQKAAYYVKHYWDDYSLADTAFIHSDDTEQLYADFLDALQYVDATECRSALQSMMSLMETDSIAYAHFCTLGEKYLYNPNSPMRNENYYIPILEQMLLSTRLTELDKLRPADRLKQALKNRPGMKAPDFSYVTLKGKQSRMSGVIADYTLLFFYDPDCDNCRKYEQVLSEIPACLEMQEKGVLRVLAVYPDEDENKWLLKSSQMPKGWIVGWDCQGDIRGKALYEIRATPTLYLLDKQKKVILKDAPLEHIIQYLSTNQQE